jgi:iron complex outermembrane receptor protein
LRWARRLETQVAGQWERGTDGEREWDAETGLVWAPLRSLVFRARYQRSVETPSGETTAGSEILVGETLIDVRRDGEAVTGVRAFSRETVDAEEEISGRYSLGATYEPRWLSGLRLSVSYQLRKQERLFEDEFDPQEIVYNEGVLAARVIRAEPMPDDVAAGRPGTIVAIDLTPGNTGGAERGDIDYEVSYRSEETGTGRWRFSAGADQALRSVYEIAPGVPFVAEGGRGSNRPRWSYNGQLSWSRGAWNASTRIRHTGAVAGTEGVFNGVDASTTVDFNAGYRVRLGGADRRRDVRLNVGIGNVFDRDPPFADNALGFRGGSPLGRTYSLSARMEF